MDTEAQRQALVLQDLWGQSANSLAPTRWREQGQALAAGLAAYQGNAAAIAERVLAGAYPTVQALLGDDALAGLAQQLWRHHPPRQGDLTTWGDALPDWLAGLPEVQDWPYLPDCARLDWARHMAEHAADAQLEPESLALLGTHDPAHLAIEPRPGLSLIRSDWPVVTIWAAHQAPEDGHEMASRLADLQQALADPQPEIAVVWRPEWRAEVALLPQPMADWMSALVAEPSRPLSVLLDQAGADFDLGSWLELALRQSWIWRVSEISDRAD